MGGSGFRPGGVVGKYWEPAASMFSLLIIFISCTNNLYVAVEL